MQGRHPKHRAEGRHPVDLEEIVPSDPAVLDERVNAILSLNDDFGSDVASDDEFCEDVEAEEDDDDIYSDQEAEHVEFSVMAQQVEEFKRKIREDEHLTIKRVTSQSQPWPDCLPCAGARVR